LGEKCWNLSGAEFEACKAPLKEALQKALEDCSPEEPSKCEEKADEVFQIKLKECLANGGS
jgi:hypothetical protein